MPKTNFSCSNKLVFYLKTTHKRGFDEKKTYYKHIIQFLILKLFIRMVLDVKKIYTNTFWL